MNNHLVELVDVFPTLCELTDLPTPHVCDPIPSSQKWCTEGESLASVMRNNLRGKRAAFSQYPRPGLLPSSHTDEPRLAQIRVMGYTMRTKRYRYTEWVTFRDLTPQWQQVNARELYDHHIDPQESLNLADREELEDIRAKLSKQLRAGWREAASVRRGD